MNTPLLKTFSDKWQHFDAVDLPNTFTRAQRAAARKTFVVGALAMLDMQINMMGSLGLGMRERQLSQMAFVQMRKDLLDYETWPLLDAYEKGKPS